MCGRILILVKRECKGTFKKGDNILIKNIVTILI